MVIVSHKHKFVLFKTAKTASTSVEKFFNQIMTKIITKEEGIFQKKIIDEQSVKRCALCNNKEISNDTNLSKCKNGCNSFSIINKSTIKGQSYIIKKHINPEELIHYCNYIEGYIKVCCIRNPFTRLLSGYMYNTQEIPTKSEFKNYLYRLVNGSKKRSLNSNIHRWSLYDNKPCIDYYIRMENLKEDIIKVLNIIGIESKDYNINNLGHYYGSTGVKPPQYQCKSKKISISTLIDNIEKELYNTNFGTKSIIDRIIYIESSLGIESNEINLKNRLDVISDELEINSYIHNSIDNIYDKESYLLVIKHFKEDLDMGEYKYPGNLKQILNNT